MIFILSKSISHNLLDKINELVQSKEVIDSILQKTINKNNIDIAPIKKKIKLLENELIKIDLKKKENLQLQFEDKISFDILNQQLTFLKDKENEISPQLNILKSELNNLSYSATIDTKHIINTLKNFNDISYHSTVEQKESLLHSLIETISINNGETTKERTINKIKLYFEPVDVQAQNLTKKFATTYDRVHPIIF